MANFLSLSMPPGHTTSHGGASPCTWTHLASLVATYRSRYQLHKFLKYDHYFSASGLWDFAISEFLTGPCYKLKNETISTEALHKDAISIIRHRLDFNAVIFALVLPCKYSNILKVKYNASKTRQT